MRGLDTFVNSVAFLDRSYEMVIIAKGKNINTLRKLARNLDIEERVHFHDFVNPQVLKKILSFCSLGIISYDLIGNNNMYCAPNKLFEYAYAELPFISSPQYTFEEVLKRFNIGKRIPKKTWLAKDYKEIADLVRLAATKDNSDDFHKFKEEFCWSREELKLESLILSCAELGKDR